VQPRTEYLPCQRLEACTALHNHEGWLHWSRRGAELITRVCIRTQVHARIILVERQLASHSSHSFWAQRFVSFFIIDNRCVDCFLQDLDTPEQQGHSCRLGHVQTHSTTYHTCMYMHAHRTWTHWSRRAAGPLQSCRPPWSV